MDITKVANFILYMIENKVSYINDKKLSILLFLIDYKSLQTYDVKIFGEEYIKAPRAPEPKILSELFDIIANQEDLEEEDERLYLIQELLDFVDIEIVNKQNFIELQFIKVEEEFDKSVFTKKELKLIDSMIEKYKDTTVRNIANACFNIEKVRETAKGEIII
ncbi:MAG: SocA family protein [Arcobacteraceae bacterium]|nr:SocA family protein [Arcobacteraceae bacterium]